MVVGVTVVVIVVVFAVIVIIVIVAVDIAIITVAVVNDLRQASWPGYDDRLPKVEPGEELSQVGPVG